MWITSGVQIFFFQISENQTDAKMNLQLLTRESVVLTSSLCFWTLLWLQGLGFHSAGTSTWHTAITVTLADVGRHKETAAATLLLN